MAHIKLREKEETKYATPYDPPRSSRNSLRCNMAKIHLVRNESRPKSEKRTYGETTEKVVGKFVYGSKIVDYEYGDEEGIISTGTDLILKYLGTSDKFAALISKVADWDAATEALEDVFEDFKVNVEYWNEPSQYFEDPGDGGYMTKLDVRRANDAAKYVFQAFMLAVVSDLCSEDYVGNYWNYSAEHIPAVIADLEKDTEFMANAEEAGCPIEDVKKAFEASITEAAINSLGNEYRALDGEEAGQW